MDPKKQQMNPELQQIYDRVMSTSATPKANPTTPAAPGVQPAQPAAAATTPAVHTPMSMPMPPAAAAGVINPPTPATPTSTPAFGLPQAPTNPGAAPVAGAPGAVATPADANGKPISSGSFVFNGNKVVNSDKTKAATGTASGKKIPGFLIPIGIIILVVAWAALWAKIFGLY